MSETAMRVIEVQDAALTAYEVLQIVKARRSAARPYKDQRDKEYSENYDRLRESRALLIESLLENSPEGSLGDADDGLSEKIRKFAEELTNLNPRIEPDSLRNIISLRPRSPVELAAIFPTEEDWSLIGGDCDAIIELVNNYFPIPQEQ